MIWFTPNLVVVAKECPKYFIMSKWSFSYIFLWHKCLLEMERPLEKGNATGMGEEECEVPLHKLKKCYYVFHLINFQIIISVANTRQGTFILSYNVFI